MPINWNLFTPVDTGAMWRQGWERGQAKGKERRLSSALAAFGANPSDPQAQSALAQLSPEFAMKMASHRWELQEKEAERQRIGALLGGDQSSLPPGLNGKPAAINYRQRQQAALRAGDTAAATALGSMADDQERAEERIQKMSKVTSSFNPITGAETYYDWQGNPIGDDRHPFMRDADGIPRSDPKFNVRPPGQPDAAPPPAAAPDGLGPLPDAGGAPTGSPLDPNLAKPQANAPAGQFTAAAKPGETMEIYLRRRAVEAKQKNPEQAAEIDQMLADMLTDLGVQP